MSRTAVELLELAGNDGDAMWLVAYAYDRAMDGQPVDMRVVWPHVHHTDDEKLRAQLQFIAVTLPRLFELWQFADTEAEAAAAAKGILQEVFKLRHGIYPCEYCGQGTVDTMRPWMPGWHECSECHQARHRYGSLRVVS